MYVMWAVVWYVGCCMICKLLYVMWAVVWYVGCCILWGLLCDMWTVLWYVCICMVCGLLYDIWAVLWYVGFCISVGNCRHYWENYCLFFLDITGIIFFATWQNISEIIIVCDCYLQMASAIAFGLFNWNTNWPTILLCCGVTAKCYFRSFCVPAGFQPSARFKWRLYSSVMLAASVGNS